MKTAYIILPGTRVAVSRDGGDFKPHTLRKQLQFYGPAPTADTTMTLDDGVWQVLVDRETVIVARFDGLGGTNQFVA